MKVKLDRNYKKQYTLEQLDQAKAVIQYEKENDDFTVEQWVEMMAREALKGISVNAADWMPGWILKADATTARNGEGLEPVRRWNRRSGCMDPCSGSDRGRLPGSGRIPERHLADRSR